MVDALEVGMKLHATYIDGEFYPAEIIAISESKKRAKAPVKVQFIGYEGESWQALADLRSKKLPKAAAPKPEAKAKAKAKAKAEANKPAVDLSVLTVGTKLQAMASDGAWYAAEVVAQRKKTGAPIKVNFLGYTHDSDEWVGADKLRSKAITAVKTTANSNKNAKAKQDGRVRTKALMFHIGTNNWQRQGEFAPGSGILHASMHQTFNSMPGVKCYSIYPSKNQTDPEDDPTFKIFKLSHDIPICESVSPNSSYRWHSLSDEEFTAYRKRLEDEVCAFMDEVEQKEEREFDYLITHHAFTNAMTGAQIVARRHESGKKRLKHFNFVHGTALKMYIKEQEADPEYPLRFLPLVQAHGVFNEREATKGIWVNSEDYIGKFLGCFPNYPKSHVVFSRIGVNQKIFCPRGTQVQDLEKHMRDDDKGKLSSIKNIVTFVGKFADWKRLDAVLHAAAKYENEFPDLGTMVVGSGPPAAVEQYEGLAKKLALKRTFFLGPKGQDALAELFSASEVGMFPSYKEPFGMVFIECMACGTPTIGAKSGGPVEFVKDDQGVLIDEVDNWREEAGIQKLGEALAATVAQALNEDWKRKTKGPKCEPFVTASYSTTAQCKSMLADMKKWSK